VKEEYAESKACVDVDCSVAATAVSGRFFLKSFLPVGNPPAVLGRELNPRPELKVFINPGEGREMPIGISSDSSWLSMILSPARAAGNSSGTSPPDAFFAIGPDSARRCIFHGAGPDVRRKFARS
jgi:hypothetical protein